MELSIGPVNTADFEKLLELFDAVAAERCWIATEPGFDKDKYRAAWQGIIDGEGGAHFVACDGNEVVGALSLYPTDNSDHHFGMLVSRERRGQGVGTALLRKAFAWAQQHDIPKLTLGVFPHNTSAIRLYEKMGFVAVSRLERKRCGRPANRGMLSSWKGTWGLNLAAWRATQHFAATPPARA